MTREDALRGQIEALQMKVDALQTLLKAERDCVAGLQEILRGFGIDTTPKAAPPERHLKSV